MKAKKTRGIYAFIIMALAFVTVESISKNAWLNIVGIGFTSACLWLLVRCTKRQIKIKSENSDAMCPQAPQSTVLKLFLRKFSKSHRGSTETADFFTGSLSSFLPQPFGTGDVSFEKTDVRWVPADEIVTVSGFLLPNGMYYVGSFGGKQDSVQEPSLINPRLPISNTDVDISKRLMPYWPNFDAITSEARRGYLQWLKQGRSDPLADIGYVFLFFYGLERRVLFDLVNDSEQRSEIHLITEEVRRLLSTYGRNRSFREYAEDFLKYLSHTTFDPNFYLGPPPNVATSGYEIPHTLRIGLGQHASNEQPLAADWALAWVLADPYIIKRSQVIRCKEVFSTLFKLKYGSAHPAGLILEQNKTKLQTSYRPASAAFEMAIQSMGGPPDVMASPGTRKILQQLVDLCSSELEPYSRYLGKNPEGAEVLEGLLLLPVALWPATAFNELNELQSQIGDDLIIMTLGGLAGRFKSAGVLSRGKVLALARALESLNIGMEPDVLTGSRTPKAKDPIALFVTQPEDRSLRTTSAYDAALETLELASAVASLSKETTMLLTRNIDSWSHLSAAHRKRLKAYLRIQILQPPTLASLKKKLAPLTFEVKRTIAGLLARLVQDDGVVSLSEVMLLERGYKTLQMDCQVLYSDLHGASASNIISIKPKAGSTKSEFEPQLIAREKKTVVLDHERIAELQRESVEVSALLAQVFTDNQPEHPAHSIDAVGSTTETSADITGLNPEHSVFLRLLISRTKWSRFELESVARDMDLMLDGALLQINDMAFERFDMPATEGDDPIEINTDFLKELAL